MVATLGKVSSARKSAEYYIESQASHRPPGDYYACGEEPDGVWWNPHDLFGLDDGARVRASAFYELHQGIAPRNLYLDPDDDPLAGRPLTQNAGRRTLTRARSAAFDITFSPDKSVSALWAMSHGDLHDGLARAHDDAVRTALDHVIAPQCSWTRTRPKGEPMKAVPAKIMGASFQHQSSRAGDPQLHTHCVLFNLALADDGKWRALHAQPLFAWYKTAGAVYRNALAWNISQRLNLAIERHGRNGEQFRIRGVPQEITREWSSRRRVIVSTARDMGTSTADNPARAQAINKWTRESKERGLDPSTRAALWDFTANRILGDVQAVIDALPPYGDNYAARVDEARRLLERIPEMLTEREAVWRITDAIQRIAQVTVGLMSPDELLRLTHTVLENREVLELDRWGDGPNVRADMAHSRVFTTRTHLDAEQGIRRMAQTLVARPAPEIAPGFIDDHLGALAAQGKGLSIEQEEALRHACSSHRNVIIEGAAGSGKTTTLAPLAAIARAAGWEVCGTANAWKVSNALGSECRIQSWCTQSLLNRIRNGRISLGDRSLIIVDEAGQCSVRHTQALLDIACETGARIVWAGDTRQQQPIEAGPGLRLLRDVVGSARVNRIRRQRPDAEDILAHTEGIPREDARRRLAAMPARQTRAVVDDFRSLAAPPPVLPWQITASEALRDGDADKAVAAYRERGRLHLGQDLDDTLRRLVADWDRHRRDEPRSTAIVIARTHDELGALTPALRRRALAPEQRAGEITLTVAGDNTEHRHARPRNILIAPGERLIVRANCPHLDLYNGYLLTVREIGARVDADGVERPVITARRDDGSTVVFSPDEVREWDHERQALRGLPCIDYGYALTFSVAQGATVDRAFVLADDNAALETIYPALTRHRDRLDIYVNTEPVRLTIADSRPEYEHEREVTDQDVLDRLGEAWSRSRPKQAALDFLLAPDERAASRAAHDNLFAPAAAPAPAPEDEHEEWSHDHTARVRPAAPGGMSALAWLRANRAADRATPFLDELVGAARTDTTARNHDAEFARLAERIAAVNDDYRAVEERATAAGTDPSARLDALRSEDHLETIRRHRAILPAARNALSRITRLPQMLHSAARAGITKENLRTLIHDYREHRSAHRSAASTIDHAQYQVLRTVQERWNAILEAARQEDILPVHVPGWQDAVTEISSAVRLRAIPERYQKPFTAILQEQRDSYRLDRLARRTVEIFRQAVPELQQLRGIADGADGAAMDWARASRTLEQLEGAFRTLPPAARIDPHIRRYNPKGGHHLLERGAAYFRTHLQSALDSHFQRTAQGLADLVRQVEPLKRRFRTAIRDYSASASDGAFEWSRLHGLLVRLDRALPPPDHAPFADRDFARAGLDLPAVRADNRRALAEFDAALDRKIAGIRDVHDRGQALIERFDAVDRRDIDGRGMFERQLRETARALRRIDPAVTLNSYIYHRMGEHDPARHGIHALLVRIETAADPLQRIADAARASPRPYPQSPSRDRSIPTDRDLRRQDEPAERQRRDRPPRPGGGMGF